MSNEDNIVDEYNPVYDEYMDVWNVKNTTDGVCYPMTSEVMANEVSNLLNHYHNQLMDSNNELYKKDRKLEELGFNLDELDAELNII